jgi:uncharacterized repeat protein (TIGR01451 family)
MTNLLSAVSGQFGKTLIFSTLLPVIVFIVMARVFAVPLLPPDLQILGGFESLDPQWKLAVTTFAALVLTGLLYNLNIPIIRFYEGYPWKESWIGKWKVERSRARFDALDARWRGMRTLVYAASPGDEVTEPWTAIGLAVNRQFPNRRALVLPTRLGNTIRSFEFYPDLQYGMDAIALWPRLIGVLDKEYAAAVDEAKGSFDFMLNCAVLSAATSVMILVAGLLRPIPLAIPGRSAGWLIEIAAFAALSHLFYLVSVGRAAAWGEMVKGAFDLYRSALLRQLGYQQTPATRAEERELWDDVSRQILYGDSPRLQIPAYSPRALSARGEPPYVPLEVGRGVTHATTGTHEEMIVTIRVGNTDSKKRTVEGVRVTDTLPEGFDYVWDSAEIGGAKIPVSGSNPHVFTIGDVASGHPVELTYRAVARGKK